MDTFHAIKEIVNGASDEHRPWRNVLFGGKYLINTAFL